MNTRYLLMAALLAAAAVSCQKETSRESTEAEEVEMTFHASFAGASTRTAVQENGTSVWWAPGDKIRVFYGALALGRFTSTNPEAAPVTDFTGTLSLVTATLENGAAGAAFWGVYPYDATGTCDGESVTLPVSGKQTGAAGTFAAGQFPAIAKSAGMDLAFYNVCGGVVFTVASEGIRSVTFEGRKKETVAGTVKVGFDAEGVPEVQAVTSGLASVTLEAPAKGTFTPGARYFITLLPGTFADGYTLTFKKDDKEGTLVRTGSTVINRSRFRLIENADASVQFHDVVPDPRNIVFADKVVKEALVASFDTDGDGELSYAEAASVTEHADFAAALSDAKLCTSFDEFRYFTGLAGIPDYCFYGWELMSSIILPSQITHIGSLAFSGCTSLPSITIPPSVESVGEGAFQSCSTLSAIIIPDSVTMMHRRAFQSCSSLSSAKLSDNLSVIEEGVFEYCTMLEEVQWPSNLEEVGYRAFADCQSLVSADLPQGIETVGHDAFSGCSRLEAITLPEGLTSLGSWSFAGCSYLDSVIFPRSLETIGHEAFRDCSRLESVAFQGNNLALLDWATFENCSSLLSISIPAGITVIGAAAFRGCGKLVSVSIPDTVEEIQGSAFAGCSSLVSVSLPDHLLEIGYELFRGCTSLPSIDIPDTVREIGAWAFEGCSSLDPILLPKDLVKIGNNAFGSCTSLKSMVIPEGVTILGDEVFGNCTQLASVSLPSTLSVVGSSIFVYEGLKTATVGNWPELPANMFLGCDQLETVVLPEGMTSIGASAFMGCSALHGITLPQSLREIQYMAFFGAGLTALTIPENVEWIGGGTFGYCNNLTEVIVKPTTPPGMELPGPYSEPYQVYAFIGSSCPIYVPDESLGSYKTHEAWSAYADRIYPVSERNH